MSVRLNTGAEEPPENIINMTSSSRNFISRSCLFSRPEVLKSPLPTWPKEGLKDCPTRALSDVISKLYI
jgi:hypothetical protein